MSRFTGDAGNELGKFADPFTLPSQSLIPLDLTTAMDYCKYLYYQTPMYRAVVQRVVGHFVTDLDYRGEIGSPKEREDFTLFFEEELGAMQELRLLGQDHGCYGNAFLRVYFPFVRTLIDRRNGFKHYTLSYFPEELTRFDLTTMTYEVPDPSYGHMAVDKRPKVKFTFRDTPAKDFSKIRLRRLDPRYVRLRFDDFSGRSQVQYNFPPDYRNKVRTGQLYVVNNAPADVLQCIRDNNDYLFDERAVFHLKNPTISGISNEGWGLPEILAQFPTIHKIAVYDRIDESIGLDYLQPLRVLTPDVRALTAENRDSQLAKHWVGAVDRMVAEQRKDRTKISAFPFACELQALGVDGKNLSPKDLKEFEVQQLLDGMGYPVELMRMNLTAESAPAAIRMFESAMYPLSQGLKNAVRFAVERISRYMFGEPFDATLQSPGIADDIERRALIFNLYSAGEIPRAVAFKSLGLDQPEELKVMRAKEDLAIQEKLTQLEEDAQRRAALGSLNEVLDTAAAEQEAAAGGGMTAPGGPVVTPTDMRAQAEQLAQQWLAIPHDGQRSQAMQQVRAANADLYAVAKDVMEEMRSQGASQGRQQVAEQMQQGGM